MKTFTGSAAKTGDKIVQATDAKLPNKNDLQLTSKQAVLNGFKSNMHQPNKAVDITDLNVYFSKQHSSMRQEYINQFMHLTSTPN